MIVSASRRTDIPAFYMDWLISRLRAGHVLVRNPMNHSQVSRISLRPEVVDGIVFWSKNPAPMLDRLQELEQYPYYVQFTLNPYGQDVEPDLPLHGERLDTFRRLAEALGPECVVWRYSPLLLNRQYTASWHLEQFARSAAVLAGSTQACNFSFLDRYAKIDGALRRLGVVWPAEEEKVVLARKMQQIAAAHGIRFAACGDKALAQAGIPAARCVDDARLSAITGSPLRLGKDAGQRADCSCVASVDVGSYNSCSHGCAYCYANPKGGSAPAVQRYDRESPMLCDSLGPGDVVRERQVASNAERQLRFD